MKKTESIRLNLKLFPLPHLVLLCGLFLLFWLGQLMQNKIPERQVITLELPAETQEAFAQKQESPEAVAPENWRWQEEKVKTGDSLSTIFKRVGISSTTLHTIMIASDKSRELTQILPGHQLRFAFDQNNQLIAIQYIPSKLEQIHISRKDDSSFSFEYINKKPIAELAYKHATIEDSLFLAGQKAGVSQGIIMQVANVFSGVIDFVFDPRKGDRFDVLFEEEFLDGEKIGNGRLLAASYTNQDETFTAFRYTFEDGRIGYYNPEGVSMSKPFLRAPLDFTRISSGFNMRRMHPIHKKIKAHRGMDYVAPRGTPIFSVADGRVSKAGFSKANGNFVFISHNSRFTTKYLHLDKRYVKTGQKVRQRTVIGTLGSTGYSTGPHLHYEFLVDGVHRDPKTIYRQLPSAEPIPKEEKPRFDEQVKIIKLQYNNLQYASNSE